MSESSEPAPPITVDVPVGDARVADAVAAVEAVLGGDHPAVTVRVVVAEDHPDRALLVELCAADSRVSVVSAATEADPVA